jgi:hypothetical protein
MLCYVMLCHVVVLWLEYQGLDCARGVYHVVVMLEVRFPRHCEATSVILIINLSTKPTNLCTAMLIQLLPLLPMSELSSCFSRLLCPSLSSHATHRPRGNNRTVVLIILYVRMCGPEDGTYMPKHIAHFANMGWNYELFDWKTYISLCLTMPLNCNAYVRSNDRMVMNAEQGRRR